MGVKDSGVMVLLVSLLLLLVLGDKGGVCDLDFGGGERGQQQRAHIFERDLRSLSSRLSVEVPGDVIS